MTHKAINDQKADIRRRRLRVEPEDRCIAISADKEDEIFPSMVKSAPETADGESPNLSVKYEIHSLLVDT